MQKFFNKVGSGSLWIFLLFVFCLMIWRAKQAREGTPSSNPPWYCSLTVAPSAPFIVKTTSTFQKRKKVSWRNKVWLIYTGSNTPISMLSPLTDLIFPSFLRSAPSYSEFESSSQDLGVVSIAKDMVILMTHAPILKFVPNVVSQDTPTINVQTSLGVTTAVVITPPVALTALDIYWSS